MKNKKLYAKNVGLFVSLFFMHMFVYAQSAADKINSANEALKAEDFNKAFQLYDDALKNLGDVQVDESINFNVGYAAYKAAKFKEAIDYFTKAVDADVNVSKSWEYKALCFNELKDYTNAVDCFVKAAEKDSEGGASLYYNAAITAYKGDMAVMAADLFAKTVELGYKTETAQYYRALALKKQGDLEAYKQALTEGVEKFPADKKLSEALVNEYVKDANELYKKGVEILNAVNQKVNDGSLTTADNAYAEEVKKAKVEFQSAKEILEKAVKIDSQDENAKKLLEACNQNLAL